MRHRIPLTIATLIFSSQSFGFSAIVSAENLVSESQVIVLAEVTSVRTFPGPPQEYRLAVADVIETWKGTLPEPRIEFVASEKVLGEGEGGINEDHEYFDLLPNI